METVLIVVHLMIVVALIALVLLQRSEGGALGIGGGGGGGGPGGFMSGRGTANILTRTTAILAVGFFTTSIVLTILAGTHSNQPSILDDVAPTPGAPAPAVPLPDGTEGTGGGVLPLLRGEPQPPTPPTPGAPSPQ